mgnify:CR=1 FL=1
MKIVLICIFLFTEVSLTAQEKLGFVDENNFTTAYNTGKKYFLSEHLVYFFDRVFFLKNE